MNVSVVVFPGSNCDHDAIHAYRAVLGQTVHEIWHKDSDLKNPDLVVIPGGFSYGDYLRAGALAKISPVMEEVVKFAKSGGPVIGICNGFQILCEAGLLPGVLLQNRHMQFLSQFVHMKVENSDTPFTRKLSRGEIISCPIAHNEGNFFVDPEGLERLESEGDVVLRYCSSDGRVAHASIASNPNGALNSIAGISNKRRNVLGLMPHPERAIEKLVGHIGAESGLGLLAGPLG